MFIEMKLGVSDSSRWPRGHAFPTARSLARVKLTVARHLGPAADFKTSSVRRPSTPVTTAAIEIQNGLSCTHYGREHSQERSQLAAGTV